MNQKFFTKIRIGLYLIIAFLISIGLSYAYFSANLIGGEDSTTINISGGTININYSGGKNINLNNIYPKNEVLDRKTFTVTANNTTDLDAVYTVSLVVEENTFTSSALKYTITSENTGNNGEVIPSKLEYNNILYGSRNIVLGSGKFTGPTINKTHTYHLDIFFPDTGEDQNVDQGKIFRGYISIKEGTNIESIPSYYVMATDDDFKTFEIENWIYDEAIDDWSQDGNINAYLYIGSDDYVIIPEIIKDELVTTAYGMFGELEDVDGKIHYSSPVKGVATKNSNITDMSYMFAENESTSLDLSYLKTSNVRSMGYMFLNNKAKSLDLQKFDTSKVNNMTGLFYGSQAMSLNISNFDTSNVTRMEQMFLATQIESLDLSHFNTSNVIEMDSMFSGTEFKSLDLQNFNTSKVTSMSSMFSNSKVISLNISSFDTSNVIDMHTMFSYSEVQSLDLSHFDTSKVTSMWSMFSNSKVTSLNISHFDTSNVTEMWSMFSDSNVPILDLSSFDVSNISLTGGWTASMENMFVNSKATIGYARTEADANKLNSTLGKPISLNFIVKQPV